MHPGPMHAQLMLSFKFFNKLLQNVKGCVNAKYENITANEVLETVKGCVNAYL